MSLREWYLFRLMKRGLTGTILAGLLCALMGPLPAQDAASSSSPTSPPVPTPPPLSPVILAENPEVVQRFAVDPTAVRAMLNSCLLKLTSASDIGTAWARLGITPRDVVGIKITTLGGPLLSTHRPIVQAICDGLQAAGVPSSQIIVWDKDGDAMRRAGYIPVPSTDSHVGISSIFPGAGYDPNIVYHNEQVGTLIWGDYEFVRNDAGSEDLFDAAREAVNSKGFGDDSTPPKPPSTDGDPLNPGASIPQTSTRSYFNWLVTHTCTKIINVPVLTDNSYIGINGCLGSLALACVDNNRRFQGDPSFGDPAICEILQKDFIRRKVVVHILDALISQYAGGPAFNPQFTRSIGAIYVSRDPVAIDTLVLKRIEGWRHDGHIDPIDKAASHVHSAAMYNLGTDDLSRIQLVRVP